MTMGYFSFPIIQIEEGWADDIDGELLECEKILRSGQLGHHAWQGTMHGHSGVMSYNACVENVRSMRRTRPFIPLDAEQAADRRERRRRLALIAARKRQEEIRYRRTDKQERERLRRLAQRQQQERLHLPFELSWEMTLNHLYAVIMSKTREWTVAELASELATDEYDIRNMIEELIQRGKMQYERHSART
jgi:hypothetical protein